MCGLVKVVGDWIRELYRGISFQVSTISILLSKLQIVHGRSYRSQINRLLSDQQSTFTKMHLEWLVRIFYTELFLKQKIETAFPSYPKDVTFRPHKKGDLKCTRTFDGCLKKQPPSFFVLRVGYTWGCLHPHISSDICDPRFSCTNKNRLSRIVGTVSQKV